MRIYQNDLRGNGLESKGFTYHASRRAARAEAARIIRHTKEDPEPVVAVETNRLNVKPTRAGIIQALNRYGAHNDNG